MRRLFFMIVIAVVAALPACKAREGVIQYGDQRLTVTDEELANYVAWWRDDLRQANRNMIEMDAMTKNRRHY